MQEKSIIGQKFNNLTVLLFSRQDKWSSKYYSCKCDCGNEKVIRATDFTTGRTKSCGCLQKERTAAMGKARKLPNGESPVNTLYIQYRKSAEVRDLKFELSKDSFFNLIKRNCFYCAIPPTSICRSRHYPDTDFVIYNGIDRRDSSGHYTIENCVPCCGSCNYMKSDMPEKEFLDKVRKIFHTHNNETSQH